jgi:hypothetical protein
VGKIPMRVKVQNIDVSFLKNSNKNIQSKSYLKDEILCLKKGSNSQKVYKKRKLYCIC